VAGVFRNQDPAKDGRHADNKKHCASHDTRFDHGAIELAPSHLAIEHAEDEYIEHCYTSRLSWREDTCHDAADDDQGQTQAGQCFPGRPRDLHEGEGRTYGILSASRTDVAGSPNISAMIRPGTTPPRNILPTDMPVRPPITTMTIEGGMIGPITEPHAVTAAE